MTGYKRKLSFERRLARRGWWVIAIAVLIALATAGGIVRVVHVWRQGDVYRQVEMAAALDTLAQSLDSTLRQELPRYCIGTPDLSLFSCARITGLDGSPIFPDNSRVPEPAGPAKYIPLLRQRGADISRTGMPVATLTNTLPESFSSGLLNKDSVADTLVRLELGWRMAAAALASNDTARALAVYRLLCSEFGQYCDADGFPVELTARLEEIRLCDDKKMQARMLREWIDDIITHYTFSSLPDARSVMPVLLKRADAIAERNVDFITEPSFLILTNMLFPSMPPTCIIKDENAEYRLWLKPAPAARLIRTEWQADATPVASNAFVYVRISAPGEPEPIGEALATNMYGVTLSVVPFDAVAWYGRRTRTAAIQAGLLGIVCLGALGFAWRMNTLMKAERRLKLQELNFVAAVSHELRSPISSVKVLAEAIERGIVRSGDEQQRYGKMIVNESNRLTRLVDNILDVSRGLNDQPHLAKEMVPVSALLEHASAAFSETEKTIITVDCPKDLRMMADRTLLERVLYNLVDNAVKYRVTGNECRITLTARAVENTIEIEAADNGIGISEDEQERIFDRFYRVGNELVRERPGTGLGLAIVKNIVERHEGEIRVESTVGVGSRFIIRLPASVEF